MRQIHPVLRPLEILLRKFLHLNTFLPHGCFLLSNNFREWIVFYGVSDALHPQIPVLRTGR